MIPSATRQLLIANAERYETPAFIEGDPSWFMHQVKGDANREAMAFVASCLSYGSRQQFMPRIDLLRQQAQGEMHQWILSGEFSQTLPANDNQCFYRLYTMSTMHHLLAAYQQMLQEYGSMRSFVRQHATTAIQALQALTDYFAQHGSNGVVPANTSSACKRLCMFLRWMVRTDSPVDLGLWGDIIDRSTLIMPLDTHVLQQSMQLGLLSSKTASMRAAQRLTDALREIFHDDPLRGDFALFGYGVEHDGR